MTETVCEYHSCRIMSDSLTDGSLAYSVVIPRLVRFDCISQAHAWRLAAAIDLAPDMVTL